MSQTVRNMDLDIIKRESLKTHFGLLDYIYKVNYIN